MIDILVDPITHKIDFCGGDLKLVDGLDQLKQWIKQKLLVIFGEWPRRGNDGIKYIEEVFIKNPNSVTIDAMFRTSIDEIQEITDITNFNYIENKKENNITINYEVISIYGNIEDSIVIQ